MNNKNLLLAFLAVVFLSGRLSAQCRIDYSNYHLILNEHFDNLTSVSQLSPRWTFTHPIAPDSHDLEYWDQNQLSLVPFDVNDPSKGKVLRLTATKIPPINMPGRTNPVSYASGMLKTNMNIDTPMGGIQYGIFEMRARLPTGDPGITDSYPTFWYYNGPTEIDMIDNGHPNQGKKLVGGIIDWTRYPEDPAGWNNGNWVKVCDCQLTPSNPLCGSTKEFDCVTDYAAGDFAKRYNKVFQTNTFSKHSCFAGRNTLQLRDFADAFNTYTFVWTPNEVAFFFNGRVQYIVEAGNVPTWVWTGALIASLQIAEQAQAASYSMDIDYIRIYKPNNGDYNQPYLKPYETINHDLSASVNPLPVDINWRPNSIVTNPNNPNEIFYRGVDACIYAANKVNGTWSVKKLEFNDGDPNFYNSWAAGDVRYLPQHDMIVYAGQNGRINIFGRSNFEPCGFYHWYLRNDWSVGNYDMVSTDPGALQTAPNGDIFFKGTDSKMHRYHFAGGAWQHSILPSAYSGTDLVRGDIEVEPGPGNHPFYKGMDGKVQLFWLGSDGVYNHTWANNSNKGPSVYDGPSSMVQAPGDGLFYIGTDKRIYNFKWNPATSSLEWSAIPYTYGGPNVGYPNGDLARGGLAWDDTKKRLYYGGYDGRIQWFGKDVNNNWVHNWLDDYWESDEYSTFNSTVSYSLSPSLILGYDGPERSLFYTRYPFTKPTENTFSVPLTNNYHISYFKYEPCMPLRNPVQNSWQNLYKPAAPGPDEIKNAQAGNNSLAVAAFPNPVSSELHLKWTAAADDKSMMIRITDMLGKTAFIKTVVQKTGNNELVIDLGRLAPGIYAYRLCGATAQSNGTFTKRD